MGGQQSVDFPNFSCVMGGGHKLFGSKPAGGQKELHINKRKKIIVFRRKGLASFVDKCISIFNKTPIAAQPKAGRGAKPNRKQKRAAKAKANAAQEKQPKRLRATKKEIQMLRNHVPSNIGSVGAIVNSLVAVVALALIGSAYFSALGQLVA